MKKCPKCQGNGIIANYIMIDGGKCYSCNGHGQVDDNYILPKPRIEYEAPKWILAKEQKATSKARENERLIQQRSRQVLVSLFNIDQYAKLKQLQINEDVISSIDSWKYSNECLVKMSDVDFQNVIIAAYEDYLQYA